MMDFKLIEHGPLKGRWARFIMAPDPVTDQALRSGMGLNREASIDRILRIVRFWPFGKPLMFARSNAKFLIESYRFPYLRDKIRLIEHLLSFHEVTPV